MAEHWSTTSQPASKPTSRGSRPRFTRTSAPLYLRSSPVCLSHMPKRIGCTSSTPPAPHPHDADLEPVHPSASARTADDRLLAFLESSYDSAQSPTKPPIAARPSERTPRRPELRMGGAASLAGVQAQGRGG